MPILLKLSCIVHGFEPRMPFNINTQYNIQFNEASNYFIQTREDIEYQPRDWVLIKRERPNTIKLNIDDQLKLPSRYCEPFKNVKQSNTLNYQIRIINRMNRNRMIRVDDKPFIEETTTGRRFCTGCIYLRRTNYGGIVCWGCARIARVNIVSYEAYLNKLAREER
ncbi:hypothetical protein ACTFIW_000955 [Dictyostelium discoideum]